MLPPIAACLIVPLDVDYLVVYNKHQNKISVGTGLSSYIMVHQNYVFNYAYPYTLGPTNYYVVPNNGKLLFFGVLNLNATYQRQLNSKLGFSVQPLSKNSFNQCWVTVKCGCNQPGYCSA